MPRHHDRLAELRRKMPKITDQHGVRRFIALGFRFYERCENRACRRAGQCVGEAAPCFDAFWWDLPEIRKDIYRESVRARMEGAKTAEEIEAAVFPKIMAVYSREQILAAAAALRSPKPARYPRGEPAISEPVLPEPVLPRARIL
jgi:hypothetical protein